VGKWVGYGETGPDPRFTRFRPLSPAFARLAGFNELLKEFHSVSFFFDNLFDSLKYSKN